MIIPSEIKPNETVKILCNYDDVEEELYALVDDVFTSTMTVKYFLPTSKFYKGAPIYELSEDTDPVLFESLVEHYIEESPLTYLRDNMYYDKQDETNSETSIEDMSDSDCESEDSFIVPDDEVDGEVTLPPDHREVDREWEAWRPSTVGAKKFKDTVDRLEAYARLQADELQFWAMYQEVDTYI